MKVKISIRILGHQAPDLDIARLLSWRSALWELYEGCIETMPLNGPCDLESWGYSDKKLIGLAPPVQGADLSIYVMNVPLQDNYYFRRIARDVACLSLFEIGESLREHNIPVENVVLRMAYSSVMIYARKGHLPPMSEVVDLAHHETKGCIFDMAGIKSDIIFSTGNPRLCEACRVEASQERMTNESLDA